MKQAEDEGFTQQPLKEESAGVDKKKKEPKLKGKSDRAKKWKERLARKGLSGSASSGESTDEEDLLIEEEKGSEVRDHVDTTSAQDVEVQVDVAKEEEKGGEVGDSDDGGDGSKKKKKGTSDRAKKWKERLAKKGLSEDSKG